MPCRVGVPAATTLPRLLFPWLAASRRRLLQRRREAEDGCTGVRWPPRVVFFDGDSGGHLRYAGVSEQGLWLAGGGFGLLRPCCSKLADLRSGEHGVGPGRRATVLSNPPFAVGRSFGSQSFSCDGASSDHGVLGVRLPLPRRCFGGGDGRCRASTTSCAGTPKGLIVILFLFLGCFLLMFWTPVCSGSFVWVLLHVLYSCLLYEWHVVLQKKSNSLERLVKRIRFASEFYNVVSNS